ncbi:uncharacterized protein EV420DRAFT_1645590 [Desarmillaria tabescens]|uniref:Protein kinase domain-containing protein n=1 Tax=Armillaria tabescens TaxID=1929756 RepID=A0AA39K1E1_ARMTA|nr:uncharacterized protein EV420DRAFT_1645590 [Desarmillaria tabescens]KAK0452740.1 hypothetical protein EV420DRAFT_1645590 [Desarmillaria tabescens]
MTHLEWPKTLQEWRDRCWKLEGSWPYDLWRREPLRKFFQENGYTLWINLNVWGLGGDFRDHLELFPPNDEPRRPDGYTFVSRYQCEPGLDIGRMIFGHLNNIHCPARTAHNQDVLIRLSIPWFYDVEEILDYLVQIFRGIKYCHDNMIAHLDLDSDNILFNFIGYQKEPDGNKDAYVTWPFRSQFPIRYYITDSELAVCFDKDSDPASRKITSLPNVRVGRMGEYAREYAPEMLVGDPYCPFKVDVWYLGRMLNADMYTEVKGFIKKVWSISN